MITFIIPAHNEEFLIGRTISALHTAAGAIDEPYEIIVVDDASADATTTVAARCGARVVSVNYQQIAAARNAGTAQAQGDILLFVDADTHVPGTVVGAAVHAMRAGAVGGGARARFDGFVPI
jgi:glycosyltransferase involved in cell wall biosynthesis